MSFYLHHLEENQSVLSEFMGQLRDISHHGNKAWFRRKLEQCGRLMAYELSKNLNYETIEVQSPLGKSKAVQIKNELVVASVLRAGLPLQHGVMDVLENADAAFLSAYRKYQSESQFEVITRYAATPALDRKTLILCDPMLATGHSIEQAFLELSKFGTVEELHIVSVVGSTVGVEYIRKQLPDAHLWILAIDPVLNHHQYIVPGLGDAGDLSFGEKLNEAP